jgi:A/G-specific adenine glycosylase
LIQWYKKHGRHDLPWRNTNNAYHIYVSEIMLQQTQVKTVLQRFYFQFLKTFPTLEYLANAKIDEVLKAWEGLGYYTRARNLHQAAIMTQGILPKSVEDLEKLPGIGRSTANAIACFAFSAKVPILDANVKRILYRYFAKTHANEKELWQLSHTLFEPYKNHAYEYNQAMMDIGSMICTHKNPKCSHCPFELACQGKDKPHEYALKKKKKPKEIRHRNIVIYTHKNSIAIFLNQQNLLKGLYSLKQYEHELDDSYSYLGAIKHEYTHISLQAQVYTKEVLKSTFKQWFNEEQIEKIALSKADYKALALLK